MLALVIFFHFSLKENLPGDASEGRGFLSKGGNLFENLLKAFSPESKKSHSRSRPSYSYQPPSYEYQPPSYHQGYHPPSYNPPPPEPIRDEEPVQVVIKGQHALL